MKRQFLRPFIQRTILSTRYLVLGIIFSLLLSALGGFSNNLTVANISVNQGDSTVTFDLVWDNSWHNTTSNPYSSPNNWDAAWIFVKFRDCVASNSTPFTQGLVSTNLGDHNFNVQGGAITYEPTKRDGTVGIDPSPNNTGIMLRNGAQVPGPNGNIPVAAQVRLKITNMPSSSVSLDTRVFGIEMVFVPQSPFSIGDGDGSSSSNYSFCISYSPPGGSVLPAGISSEAAQNVYERNQAICDNGGSGTCALTAAFPKGFNAFYIMKYEISQGQYVDYLNTITNSAQLLHYPSSYGSNRHQIYNNGTAPFIYNTTNSGTSKDDRACNYLAWYDLSGYLDWAALRPLTELEYEKACRGPNRPVLYEKAWGAYNGSYTYATSISSTENGTETTNSNANINTYLTFCCNFSGGDGGQGPLRCGIFATSSTTSRVQTGAGFYGAMELSGNVEEYYISVRSGSNGPSTAGVDLGDGNVDGSGNHDVADWPLPYTTSGDRFVMRRGGSWYDYGYWATSDSKTNVSSRYAGFSYNSSTIMQTNRDAYSGGRGGR